MNDAYHKLAQEEQQLLKISIGFTLLLAVVAIVTGLHANAFSIMFDGIYTVIDGIFSMAALFVLRLITLDVKQTGKKRSGLFSRFHHGFWHLEPLLLMINSSSLVGAVLFALIESVNGLLSGGSKPAFLPALLFALFAMSLSLIIATYQHRVNKRLQSGFIAVDEKSWFIAAAINGALLFAFAMAILLEKTAYASWAVYIDPLILTIIALAILPSPLKILINSLKAVLLITPKAKDEEVETILKEMVKKYNFEKAHHYLALVGRSLIVEIHIILPKNYTIKNLEFFDNIREELSEKIGDAGPNRWFTVSFTTDEKWAL